LLLVLHQEWLALYLSFSSVVGKKMFQTLLLTNKNQENWTNYTALTLLSQRELALTARNTLFAL
jgi:hypothetical protein